LKIALCKSNTGFHSYINWLEYFKVDFIIFDWKEKTPTELFDECSGLILTGGTDIYPGFYKDIDDVSIKESYTPERDSYEMELIENTLKYKKPVLGICRGNQLLNVYFKGTLIQDIKSERGFDHSKISESEIRHHDINVKTKSLLFKIVNEKKYSVTSTHHQAIDKPGEGLAVNAIADDGIIEGIEFEDKKDKSFLLGIQWHPERMINYDNPFSKNVLLKFIEEAKRII